METVDSISALRRILHDLRADDRTIALVPTLGALHAGHGACIDVATRHGDVVVVSIFLNPTQFGRGEDLDRYPVALDEDLAFCRDRGCDVVFAPATREMYPQEQTVWVEPSDLARPLCGRSRKGHFRAVCTVVAKLFNIVEPHVAVFGQKDAQQALVIRDMVRQLSLPVELRLCPIVRDNDGLALSSRNAYLSPDERARAPGLNRSLRQGLEAVRRGERRARSICQAVRGELEQSGIKRVEYVELLEVESLKEPGRVEGRLLLAAAVYAGSTRLIDNVVFSVDAHGTVTEQLLF